MVYEILPAPGENPIRVHTLAQKLPLTLAEVSSALQVLKRDHRAMNPRGRKTNSWTRDVSAPVEPEAQPELHSGRGYPIGPAKDPDAVLVDPVRAWVDAGRAPESHRRAQKELRRSWPTLARALDRLTREGPR